MRVPCYADDETLITARGGQYEDVEELATAGGGAHCTAGSEGLCQKDKDPHILRPLKYLGLVLVSKWSFRDTSPSWPRS